MQVEEAIIRLKQINLGVAKSAVGYIIKKKKALVSSIGSKSL